MSSTRNLFFSLALCTLAALPSAPATSAAATNHQGWGLSARTDRPFYAVGSTARARFVMENFSPDGAFGFVPATWQNGCAFKITVVDDQGQTVWQPFTPCFFGGSFLNLSSGQVLRGGDLIPLVYQNNLGIGTPGAPLVPGAYKVCVEVSFAGPTRTSTPPSLAPGGLGYEACIPIRIEL